LMENENPRWRKLAGVFLRLSRLQYENIAGITQALTSLPTPIQRSIRATLSGPHPKAS
jgi:hypothetical protein